jgi:hypothetical protein
MMFLRELAQSGYCQIRAAIVGLLEQNTKGLTHADIVGALGLYSEYEGKHTNYLTWSILGNLIKDNIIEYSGSGKNRVYKLK